MPESNAIKAIDCNSVHRITSGQVVIDLQTAVKELVENSLDAGATNIEVRFKQYGLKSIEVIDNGSGIAEEYHESIALKHYTSKLSSFADLSTVRTFGFRGEALSSLCTLSDSVVITTATAPPMGVSLEMDASGKVRKKHKVARQRGTTVTITDLFLPLPVRRKEFDRNSKREFGKALALLNAYALGPCCTIGAGVRLTVSNQVDKGQKSVQLRTTGASSGRASVSALWGSKALDNLVDLDLSFEVERDRTALKRLHGSTQPTSDDEIVPVVVKGLISKFSIGGGRAGTDRQFFYVNGRPCNLTKIQKAFNEVYRSFNANQAPFILADFIIPTNTCDVNVSPDKRTIFLHGEAALIIKLKAALEEAFAPSRSTYDVEGTQPQSHPQRKTHVQSTLSLQSTSMTNDGRASRKEKEKMKTREKEKSVPAVDGEDRDSRSRATSMPLRPSSVTQRQPSVEVGHEGRPGPQCQDDPDPTSDIAQPPTSALNCSPSPSPSPPFSGVYPKSPTITQVVASHRRPCLGSERLMDVDAAGSSSPAFADVGGAPPPAVSGIVPSGQRWQLGHGDCMDRDVEDDIHKEGSDKGHRSLSILGTSTSSIIGAGVTAYEAGTAKSPREVVRTRDVAMVVDTSTAAWNRPPQKGDTDAGTEEGSASDDDNGPTKKKRRSEAGVVVETERFPNAAGVEKVRKVSGLGSVKHGAGMELGREKKRKLSAYRETEFRLRDRLSQFARTGSETPGVQNVKQEEDEANVNVDLETSEGGNSDEEVDQLDASDDISQEPLPSPDKAHNKRQGFLDEARQSTPGAETEVQHIAGEISTGAIDLTVEDDIFDDSQLDPPIFDPAQHTPSSALRREEIVTRPEVIRSTSDNAGDISLRFDISKISAAWQHLRDRLSTAYATASSSTARDVPDSLGRVPLDAGVSNTENDDRAVDALARVIEKQDFATMDVVGQFNLGFIIARRRKTVATADGRIDPAQASTDDLFIVDQHAADEKYNFETLQQTTSIKSQKLFRPQAMELTASDELLAVENLDTLRQNGFEIEVDGNGECGRGSKLKLTAQPISKSTVFDMKDLEELIHLMRDRPTGQMVRCSKARAMFAMRACRKSVMIGMPLNRQQMSLVVQHMGTMDQPWSCPHGRPTMRHLTDIVVISPKRLTRKVDWSSAFRDN